MVMLMMQARQMSSARGIRHTKHEGRSSRLLYTPPQYQHQHQHQHRRSHRRDAVMKLHALAPETVNVLADLSSASGSLANALQPAAATFEALNLPDPLVKLGHPGNMGVVLTAMGGYGSWLGWNVRMGNDKSLPLDEAGDLHSKLMAGMFLFFALGAVGGLLSLTMQGKPLLSSAHATSAFVGLVLLSFQACLPLAFEAQPSMRAAHAYFGSAIMAVFVVHAALGIKLALSL